MGRGQPTLLIGYDVERESDPSLVNRFLAKAEEVHTGLSAPCTFFIQGQVVENNSEELSGLLGRSDLFDYQQHTYSHMLLKTVHMDDGNEITLVRGGSVEEIDKEVSLTSQLLRDRLGVECWGLTGPWGYYRGLCDRPDLLEVLNRNGIRFVRTWGRNEKDFQPVDLGIQPFFYEVQGFPHLMEFPLHGWQDVHWRNINGWDKTDEYLAFLKQTVDVVADEGITWSHGTHDWSSLREDPELSIIRGLIEKAKDAGLRILDYKTFYLEALENRYD
jgi:hypothetical protein